MNIYSFPTFNLAKIILTAEEVGMNYKLHLLDISKQEHKNPEHIERHPLGKVPAVEYQGKHYIESNSICRLIAEANGNKLYADSPEERAIINQWVDLMGQHIGHWMRAFFFDEGIKPYLLGIDGNPKKVTEAAGFLGEQLPTMEKALSQHTFLSGDAITIADTIAFSYCLVQDHTSLSLADYPNLQTWYESMKARPSYTKMTEICPDGITPFKVPA